MIREKARHGWALIENIGSSSISQVKELCLNRRALRTTIERVNQRIPNLGQVEFERVGSSVRELVQAKTAKIPGLKSTPLSMTFLQFTSNDTKQCGVKNIHSKDLKNEASRRISGNNTAWRNKLRSNDKGCGSSRSLPRNDSMG
jgi:hypothetical protein